MTRDKIIRDAEIKINHARIMQSDTRKNLTKWIEERYFFGSSLEVIGKHMHEAEIEIIVACKTVIAAKENKECDAGMYCGWALASIDHAKSELASANLVMIED